MVLWILLAVLGFRLRGFHPLRLAFPKPFCYPHTLPYAVRTPECSHPGLGSFPFARRYSGNHCCFLFLRLLRCFSSPGSPCMPMCSAYSGRSSSGRVSPFRHRRVIGYLLLTAAFRSLSRLSSALSAKASTLCPSSLDLLFPRPRGRGYGSLRWICTISCTLVLVLENRFFSVTNSIGIDDLRTPQRATFFSKSVKLNLKIFFRIFDVNSFPYAVFKVLLVVISERNDDLRAIRRFLFFLSLFLKEMTTYAPFITGASGDKEIRTPDPLLARQVLSQLSYTPIFWHPPALPCRPQHSTIGRLRLNHRVRDGYGCVPQAHQYQKLQP